MCIVCRCSRRAGVEVQLRECRCRSVGVSNVPGIGVASSMIPTQAWQERKRKERACDVTEKAGLKLYSYCLSV